MRLRPVVSKRSLACGFAFSTMLAASLVVGRALWEHNTIYALGSDIPWPMALVSFILLALAGGLPFSWCFQALSRRRPRASRLTARLRRWGPWRAFAACWLLYLALWMPCLLAYWPGVFAYDILAQTNQVLSGSYVSHHPPLHTLVWAGALAVSEGLPLSPITVYGLFQMALLSASFSWCTVYLVQRGVHGALIAFAAAFFALNPVVALFSFAPTKDIFFTAFFVPLMVLLVGFFAEGVRGGDDGRGRIAAIAAIALACCLLRNNFAFAFVPFAVLAVAMPGRREAAAAAFLTPLAAFALVCGPVYGIAGVKSGSALEALCIPIQQVAYVVVNDTGSLDDGQLREAEELFDINQLKEEYYPRCADDAKWMVKRHHGGAGGVMRLWLSLLPGHLGDYADAALALHVRYWYLGSVPQDAHREEVFIETRMDRSDAIAVVPDSKLPRLKELYDSVASYESFADVPLVSVLFSSALPLWMVLFVLLSLVAGGRRASVALLLPLALILTYLLGPISFMRYVFPIYALYPLLLALAFDAPALLGEKDAGAGPVGAGGEPGSPAAPARASR